MSERSDYDRLRRVEEEAESLLAEVREQVLRLRTTVDRLRALRGPAVAGRRVARRAARGGGRYPALVVH